jgi:hypothetical protein
MMSTCLKQEFFSLPSASGADVKQIIEDRLRALRLCLPPRARALALCELYLEQYHFHPVERDDLIGDILVSVYDGNNMVLRPHQAAVLFMTLAIGALVDPSLPSYSTSAETYCMLGLQALGLRCIYASPDIETVMALSLVAAYHGDSSESRSLDTAWSKMSLALKLAQKVRPFHNHCFLNVPLISLFQIGLRMCPTFHFHTRDLC